MAADAAAALLLLLNMWSKTLTNQRSPAPYCCCPPDALMLVLRNLEYVGYATSGGKVVHDIEAAEQKFNSVLTEVRALALLNGLAHLA